MKNVSFPEEVRCLLRDARISQRKSQTEVAGSIGMTRKWLSEYERGVIDDPGFATIISLSAALGVKFSIEREFCEED